MSSEHRARAEHRLDTIALHAGQEAPDPATGARAVPIYQTTSYVFKGTEHAANLFALRELGNIYTRLMNPTTDVFERRMAALEGGTGALATSSGQAAETFALLNITQVGDNIVSANNLYGGTYQLFHYTFPKLARTVRFVDSTRPGEFAKAIDNRVGCAILVELLKNAPAHIDLCLSFAVQEEIGLRGAKVAANYFKPDLAIAIDSTPAYDLPHYADEENIFYNTKLGLGPALYTYDAGTLSDPRLVRFLAATAESEKIPFQYRQPGGGGTDAGAIHRQQAGIPSVSVSVPGRHAHTSTLVMRVDDWKNTLALVSAALQNISPEVLREERP